MTQDKRNLIVEIGTEEIPADALILAEDYLEKKVIEELEAAHLEFGEVELRSTPRRIIISVTDVAAESAAQRQEFRGPSADRAFDEDGNPTKAALGFARGKGVEVDALEKREENGNVYVYAVVESASQPAKDIIEAMLPVAISTIPWRKSQRWGSGDAHFSRPVRWLVGLLGDEVVDFEFAGLKSGRVSYGHRFLAPQPIELACADDLLPALEKAYVVSETSDRATAIRAQIKEIEEQTGLVAEVPASTFAEVLGLVEYPTCLVGHFDEEFLQVPSEIITDAMLSHQRYFPLYGKDGNLSNAFIVVGNGDPANSATIIDGNERVVRARLYDAAFFYHEDLKKPLADYVPLLEEQVFQEKLGTMKAKVDRMVALAGTLAREGGFDAATTERAERAALLAKADLVTSAVVEFTSQQGVMGGYYARAAAEPEEVAIAVEQHYRPKFAGDEVPDNDEGKLVAIADKLDTIAGLFAIGQPPTGSKDPFALRRNAIGIISILQGGFPVELAPAIDTALAGYDAAALGFDPAGVAQQIRDFFAGRLAVIAKESGYTAEVVNAVLATGVIGPVEVMARCKALTEAREGDVELFEDLETAYKRANNLRDAELGDSVDESIMGAEEKALNEAVATAQATVDSALASGDYAGALAALAALRGPIDAYFDAVMIMDKDETVRANHLRMLNRFVNVFVNVADIGKLGGK
ncbi:MAG: glycine--tRNA ligase subunit beta [Coriobacteriales bacterium]|jgi:glycyl-tRNA synthetase beta chain